MLLENEIVLNSFEKNNNVILCLHFSEKRRVVMQNGTKKTNNLIIRWIKSTKKKHLELAEKLRDQFCNSFMKLKERFKEKNGNTKVKAEEK